MTISRRRGAATTLTLALIGLAMAGCSSDAQPAPAPASTATAAAPDAAATEAPPAAPPAEPADLTGEWTQTNSKSPDSYQSATIDGTTIEVNWVSDGGDTKALYWAGSYTPPTSDGAFTWDSVNDVSKTQSAMLASSSDSKTFSYADGVISYEVSAMGVTTTVKLGKQ